MILLYEGISLLLMLFLYLALFIFVIGVITLVIGLIYGFAKKNIRMRSQKEACGWWYPRFSFIFF